MKKPVLGIILTLCCVLVLWGYDIVADRLHSMNDDSQQLTEGIDEQPSTTSDNNSQQTDEPDDGQETAGNDGNQISEPKQPSEGLEYTLNPDSKSYSVSDIGTCTDRDVVIPSTYEGKPVTGIGMHAFKDCTGLTSITIPDSVTSIGEWAFYYCESLTSISIPDSVTSIGREAFRGCESLTSIIIPDSVTNIGKGVFGYCDGLTSITIPNSVTSIGTGAFSGCKGLTSIIIPDSVTSIGYEAFSNCTGLTSITFEGTYVQWNAISKGYNWNFNTGAYTIQYTDGDIAK